MARNSLDAIECQRVELDGVQYVILRASVFENLCRMAGVQEPQPLRDPESLAGGMGLDQASLPQKLVRRRQAAGLSQAELARLAGVRPETLNRIERGRTTPDFATVRKLVVAMEAAERDSVRAATTPSHVDDDATSSAKEPDHVRENQPAE